MVSDLEYVTTPELFNELAKRFANIIIVGIDPVNDSSSRHAQIIKGNPIALYGLASVVRDQCRLHANDAIESQEEDEDDK